VDSPGQRKDDSQALVNTGNPSGSIKYEYVEFLDQLSKYEFLKKDCVPLRKEFVS
jgi:hypothetical protein